MSNNNYFCPSCNKEIHFNDPFCKTCGQPLVWENSIVEKIKNEVEPKFFNKKVWLASGGLVLINISNYFLFDKYFHPANFILTNVVNFFFYGFIFALIFSIFRKIKNSIKK